MRLLILFLLSAGILAVFGSTHLAGSPESARFGLLETSGRLNDENSFERIARKTITSFMKSIETKDSELLGSIVGLPKIDKKIAEDTYKYWKGIVIKILSVSAPKFGKIVVKVSVSTGKNVESEMVLMKHPESPTGFIIIRFPKIN